MRPEPGASSSNASVFSWGFQRFQEFSVHVSANRRDVLLLQEKDNLGGVGAVTDDIARTNDPIRAVSLRPFERIAQRRKIGMDVGEESDAHGRVFRAGSATGSIRSVDAPGRVAGT